MTTTTRVCSGERTQTGVYPCVGSGPWAGISAALESQWWQRDSHNVVSGLDPISLASTLQTGPLLPDVNTEDVCTWAAVVHDACVVAGLSQPRAPYPSTGTEEFKAHGGRWMLTGKTSSRLYNTPYNTPEQALMYLVGEYRSGDYEEKHKQRIREFFGVQEPQTDRLELLMDNE